MATYFTSDLHFCHNREFLYQPRGFENVYDMNDAIVKNWNSIVGMEDDVYVLGDLMLNDNEEGFRLLKQLNGNLHIILGNHDTDNRVELYNICYNVVECCYATVLKYGKYHFYLSHYPTLTANKEKHLSECLINLCGHTHTQDRWSDWNKGIIYHVECDAHNCTPVSIDTVINEIKDKVRKENDIIC